MFLSPSLNPILHFHQSPPSPKQVSFITTLHSHAKIPHSSFSFLSRLKLSKHLSISSTIKCFCTSSNSFELELGRLLSLLPVYMKQKVCEHSEFHQLIEVVLDLGRKPLARFPSGDFVLSDKPISSRDIEYATSQVGDFAIDNRAGISRTLHRISAIRNRKGAIIGLTCRVGRAISGSANLLKDLVNDGSSLLLIGPPGVGKTTIIREIARMIADEYKKRVMIVDTSNEIGGDGDIPHAGIGNARRMQVPNTDMQHKVLIEAVENHMPQVIVIDEIGTKLEAMAASTIAQRGIQLVATAHGVTIENLIMNPSLEMLVGGVQSVTLGDDEASRRGVQKTVLERKGPSTFACGVEIISKTELCVHRNLEATVDAVLSGRSAMFEVRKTNTDGAADQTFTLQREPLNDNFLTKQDLVMADELIEMDEELMMINEFTSESAADMVERSFKQEASIRLYVYGILETSVIQGIRQLKEDDAVELTDNISEADAMLALQSRLKKNTRIQAVAKSHNIPIYVTKTSSLVQITKAIRVLLSEHADGMKYVVAEDKMSSSEQIDALEEARLAIEQVVIPKREPVELLPRSLCIMSLQMELIQKYQLQSEKVGKETNIRLRILPLQAKTDKDKQGSEQMEPDRRLDYSGLSGDLNGSVYNVERLPLLPD
ncbi:hypothetical protein IFM89_019525 [Coptis chinensis]|uniref:AAA+ ATPase domain-containing protein n=1 Tax=Coptis chinensis TaxID=261450 RepID=A0A835M0N8_9MAGN|nr:hypothetical protein IFM89_019525 [Coptis chinensis]